MALSKYPPKHPDAVRIHSYEFSDDIPEGAEIESCDCVATLLADAPEGVTDSLVVANVVFNGTMTSCLIAGGDVGANYQLQWTVELDNGETLIGLGKLPIRQV